MANVQEIISTISQAGGLSRPNRYSVVITAPNFGNILANSTTQAARNLAAAEAARNGMSMQSYGYVPDYFRQMGLSETDMTDRLDYMCIGVELPGKTYNASDVKTYGATFQMPFVDMYSNITLSFICGRDMAERVFFDAWSYTIQDPTTSDFNYVSEYATTVDIFQLDEFHDTAQYGVRLFQCWPITVGAMSLSYENFNTFNILPVTFTYRKWVNFRINSGTPTTIEPSGGAPFGFETTIHPTNK